MQNMIKICPVYSKITFKKVQTAVATYGSCSRQVDELN